MKLHKLISRTVLATALLGTTIGGVFSGTSANAKNPDTPAGQISGSTKANPTKPTNSTTPSVYDGNIGANIQDGTLTLDSVPNLGFGNNNTGDDSSSTLKLNSSNNGNIQVTDHRNIDRGDISNRQGWSLSAKLNGFNKDGSPISDNSGWTMHLSNNMGLNNTTSPDSKPALNNADLSAGDSSSNPTIIDASASNPSNDNHITNTGYGTNTVQYNNNNSATLDIPNVESGSYTTTMTWNLNTKMGSYNTGYDQ